MIKILLLLLLFIQIIPITLNAQIDSKLLLEGAYITDIKRESDNLWVATYGQGIYQYSYKTDKWINFSTKNKNLSNDLFHCVASNKDFIWAGATEGLYIYSKRTKKWQLKKFAEGGEFGNWIRALNYEPKKNQLWIGRFRNITMYDVRSKKYFEFNRIINNNEKTNNINCIVSDTDTVLWFGAESGVHKFDLRRNTPDNQRWNYYTNKGRWFRNEGESVSISDFLFIDKFIWFGTEEFITKEQPEYNIGGIYIFDRRLGWERISKANGLNGNGIYSMERTGNYVWVGLYEFDKDQKKDYGKGLQLINRFNKKVSDLDLNELNINSSSVVCMYFDNENLWLGTANGLVKLRVANQLAKWGVK